MLLNTLANCPKIFNFGLNKEANSHRFHAAKAKISEKIYNIEILLYKCRLWTIVMQGKCNGIQQIYIECYYSFIDGWSYWIILKFFVSSSYILNAGKKYLNGNITFPFNHIKIFI